MSSQSGHLLLKNGTALIHGEVERVEAVRTDILVSGSKIAKLAPNIDPPQGSQVMYVWD
jgi:dihydroorotase-like cyclic amidohydrolase